MNYVEKKNNRAILKRQNKRMKIVIALETLVLIALIAYKILF